MKSKKNSIDHWASLCETSDETFRRLNIVSETAISLKEYRENAEELRFQVVENWCLCKYCQLFDPENENFNHWKKELRIFIRKLKFILIKNGVDKGKTLRRVWISKCDLDDWKLVSDILKDKFNEEGFSDEKRKKAVSLEFSKGVEGLIDCISNSSISPDSYIRETFKA